MAPALDGFGYREVIVRHGFQPRKVLVGLLIGLRIVGLSDAAPRVAGGGDVRHEGALARSSGEYLGHRWEVDGEQVMWWDGDPYVRFGFTGNGNVQEMLEAGFTQFTLAPAEAWAISGPDPRIVESVDAMARQLETAGATYYGVLNIFWPWSYGDLIGESDRATVFVRDVHDVSAHGGDRAALDLRVRLPISEDEDEGVRPGHAQVVLFDLEHGKRQDLGDMLEEVRPALAARDVGAREEGDAERRGGMAFRVRLKPVRFPESTSLRLVVAMAVRRAELPGVHGLVPLWKPGIRQFYERSLAAFRAAYAKGGLRGLQFSDEINTFPCSLLTAWSYLDLRNDPVALKAYREWLGGRFERIETLNQAFGTDHASFEEVDWEVPLHPYAPSLARTEEAAEREESWAGAATTWGLGGTVEQVRRRSEVQDEFRIWFCGHWLAEYGKLAKRILGPVPVFVCSAAIGGDAQQYLAMHRWALREGVDGLIRNHYGRGGPEEREALASVARWMARVQRESGVTKHLWANEIGYVRRHMTDDEWAAAEAAHIDVEGSFGSQWAFPSRQSLHEMLVLLSQYGYRGFNRFLINPSAEDAAEEVRWMAELRTGIVERAIQSELP